MHGEGQEEMGGEDVGPTWTPWLCRKMAGLGTRVGATGSQEERRGRMNGLPLLCLPSPGK